MSFTLFSCDVRTARKRQVCIWCGEAIEPGTRYFDERSVYDGNVQRHRWHGECKADADVEFRKGETDFSAGEAERPAVRIEPPAPEPKPRITDGRRFENPAGRWIKVVMNAGGLIRYNVSGATQREGGGLQCSRARFLEILKSENYTPEPLKP